LPTASVRSSNSSEKQTGGGMKRATSPRSTGKVGSVLFPNEAAKDVLRLLSRARVSRAEREASSLAPAAFARLERYARTGQANQAVKFLTICEASETFAPHLKTTTGDWCVDYARATSLTAIACARASRMQQAVELVHHALDSMPEAADDDKSSRSTVAHARFLLLGTLARCFADQGLYSLGHPIATVLARECADIGVATVRGVPAVPYLLDALIRGAFVESGFRAVETIVLDLIALKVPPSEASVHLLIKGYGESKMHLASAIVFDALMVSAEAQHACCTSTPLSLPHEPMVQLWKRSTSSPELPSVGKALEVASAILLFNGIIGAPSALTDDGVFDVDAWVSHLQVRRLAQDPLLCSNSETYLAIVRSLSSLGVEQQLLTSMRAALVGRKALRAEAEAKAELEGATIEQPTRVHALEETQRLLQHHPTVSGSEIGKLPSSDWDADAALALRELDIQLLGARGSRAPVTSFAPGRQRHLPTASSASWPLPPLLQMSPAFFAELISVSYGRNDLDSVVSIRKTLDELEIPLNEDLAIAIIAGSLRRGDVSSALSLVHQMMGSELCVGSPSVLCSFLRGLSCPEAKAAFADDETLWNRAQDVFSTLCAPEAVGLYLDATGGSLAAGRVRADASPATQVGASLGMLGIRSREVIPPQANAEAYDALLTLADSQDKTNRVIELCEDMASKSLIPTTHSVAVMLAGPVRAGKSVAALNCLEKLAASSVEDTLYSCLGITSVPEASPFSHAGWSQIVETGMMRPGDYLRCQGPVGLLCCHALVAAGRLKHAERCLRLVESGPAVLPSDLQDTYNKLALALLDGSQTSQAIRLLQRMEHSRQLSGDAMVQWGDSVSHGRLDVASTPEESTEHMALEGAKAIIASTTAGIAAESSWLALMAHMSSKGMVDEAKAAFARVQGLRKKRRESVAVAASGVLPSSPPSRETSPTLGILKEVEDEDDEDREDDEEHGESSRESSPSLAPAIQQGLAPLASRPRLSMTKQAGGNRRVSVATLAALKAGALRRSRERAKNAGRRATSPAVSPVASVCEEPIRPRPERPAAIEEESDETDDDEDDVEVDVLLEAAAAELESTPVGDSDIAQKLAELRESLDESQGSSGVRSVASVLSRDTPTSRSSPTPPESVPLQAEANSWSLLARASLAAGRPFEAVDIIGKMLGQGVTPNAGIAAALVSACATSGRGSEAPVMLWALQQVMRKLGFAENRTVDVTTDPSVVGTALVAAASAGRPDLVLECREACELERLKARLAPLDRVTQFALAETADAAMSLAWTLAGTSEPLVASISSEFTKRRLELAESSHASSWFQATVQSTRKGLGGRGPGCSSSSALNALVLASISLPRSTNRETARALEGFVQTDDLAGDPMALSAVACALASTGSMREIGTVSERCRSHVREGGEASSEGVREVSWSSWIASALARRDSFGWDNAVREALKPASVGRDTFSRSLLPRAVQGARHLVGRDEASSSNEGERSRRASSALALGRLADFHEDRVDQIEEGKPPVLSGGRYVLGVGDALGWAGETPEREQPLVGHHKLATAIVTGLAHRAEIETAVALLAGTAWKVLAERFVGEISGKHEEAASIEALWGALLSFSISEARPLWMSLLRCADCPVSGIPPMAPWAPSSKLTSPVCEVGLKGSFSFVMDPQVQSTVEERGTPPPRIAEILRPSKEPLALPVVPFATAGSVLHSITRSNAALAWDAAVGCCEGNTLEAEALFKSAASRVSPTAVTIVLSSILSHYMRDSASPRSYVSDRECVIAALAVCWSATAAGVELSDLDRAMLVEMVAGCGEVDRLPPPLVLALTAVSLRPGVLALNGVLKGYSSRLMRHPPSAADSLKIVSWTLGTIGRVCVASKTEQTESIVSGFARLGSQFCLDRSARTSGVELVLARTLGPDTGRAWLRVASGGSKLHHEFAPDLPTATAEWSPATVSSRLLLQWRAEAASARALRLRSDGSAGVALLASSDPELDPPEASEAAWLSCCSAGVPEALVRIATRTVQDVYMSRALPHWVFSLDRRLSTSPPSDDVPAEAQSAPTPESSEPSVFVSSRELRHRFASKHVPQVPQTRAFLGELDGEEHDPVKQAVGQSSVRDQTLLLGHAVPRGDDVAADRREASAGAVAFSGTQAARSAPMLTLGAPSLPQAETPPKPPTEEELRQRQQLERIESELGVPAEPVPADEALDQHVSFAVYGGLHHDLSDKLTKSPGWEDGPFLSRLRLRHGNRFAGVSEQMAAAEAEAVADFAMRARLAAEDAIATGASPVKAALAAAGHFPDLTLSPAERRAYDRVRRFEQVESSVLLPPPAPSQEPPSSLPAARSPANVASTSSLVSAAERSLAPGGLMSDESLWAVACSRTSGGAIEIPDAVLELNVPQPPARPSLTPVALAELDDVTLPLQAAARTAKEIQSSVWHRASIVSALKGVGLNHDVYDLPVGADVWLRGGYGWGGGVALLRLLPAEICPTLPRSGVEACDELLAALCEAVWLARTMVEEEGRCLVDDRSPWPPTRDWEIWTNDDSPSKKPWPSPAHALVDSLAACRSSLTALEGEFGQLLAQAIQCQAELNYLTAVDVDRSRIRRVLLGSARDGSSDWVSSELWSTPRSSILAAHERTLGEVLRTLRAHEAEILAQLHAAKREGVHLFNSATQEIVRLAQERELMEKQWSELHEAVDRVKLMMHASASGSVSDLRRWALQESVLDTSPTLEAQSAPLVHATIREAAAVSEVGRAIAVARQKSLKFMEQSLQSAQVAAATVSWLKGGKQRSIRLFGKHLELLENKLGEMLLEVQGCLLDQSDCEQQLGRLASEVDDAVAASALTLERGEALEKEARRLVLRASKTMDVVGRMKTSEALENARRFGRDQIAESMSKKLRSVEEKASRRVAAVAAEVTQRVRSSRVEAEQQLQRQLKIAHRELDVGSEPRRGAIITTRQRIAATESECLNVQMESERLAQELERMDELESAVDALLRGAASKADLALLNAHPEFNGRPPLTPSVDEAASLNDPMDLAEWEPVGAESSAGRELIRLLAEGPSLSGEAVWVVAGEGGILQRAIESHHPSLEALLIDALGRPSEEATSALTLKSAATLEELASQSVPVSREPSPVPEDY
jgi:hypothetical protein